MLICLDSSVHRLPRSIIHILLAWGRSSAIVSKHHDRVIRLVKSERQRCLCDYEPTYQLMVSCRAVSIWLFWWLRYLVSYCVGDISYWWLVQALSIHPYLGNSARPQAATFLSSLSRYTLHTTLFCFGIGLFHHFHSPPMTSVHLFQTENIYLQKQHSNFNRSFRPRPRELSAKARQTRRRISLRPL